VLGDCVVINGVFVYLYTESLNIAKENNSDNVAEESCGGACAFFW